VPPVQVSTITANGAGSDADTVAIGLFAGDDAPAGAPAEVGALLASGEARRSFKALALTHAAGRRWLLVGLGAREQFTAERARVAGAVAAERAREIGTRTLCWELPAQNDPDAVAGALVEGTILRDYRYERDKSKAPGADGDEDAAPGPLEALVVAAGDGGADVGDATAHAATCRTGQPTTSRRRRSPTTPAAWPPRSRRSRSRSRAATAWPRAGWARSPPSPRDPRRSRR
jgi:leucyl aminopeptidase